MKKLSTPPASMVRLPGRLSRSMGWLLLLLLLGASPLVRATNPVLLIQGTGNGGGDVTAFIDLVQIVQVSNGTIISGAVGNADFDTPNVGANSFQYNPSASPWIFSSQSGISQTNSGFAPTSIPSGAQVALVQGTSTIQQTLALGSGTYVVKFMTTQRTNCCGAPFNQQLNVYIAGSLVGTIQPPSNNSYIQFTSNPFTVDPPAVSSFTPTRNALAVAVATNVAVNFSQNMDNATASAIKVFSAQAGGKKAGTYSTSGGAVTFDPTANFKPGETVFTTIPAAVASTGGAINTTPQVNQFTTTTSGTGRGNFLPGSDLANGGGVEVVAADFNGDGILDLADTGGGLEVRFGTGTGTYGAATTYASAGGYFSLTAGDLDGDGDIDLVVPRTGGTIAVMQNNGSGAFTALTAAISNGSDPRKAALGDIDADGDLDMLVPISGGGGAVGVYFNNGSGGFSAPVSYGGSANSTYVVLGDLDRDGDLDYAVADYNNARVVVRLNNGSGGFGAASNVAVGNSPGSLALADVNGDGALDILTANEGVASVSVSLNGNTGTGSFNASSAFAVPATCAGVAVGDVDADGDLDLVAGSRGATGFYLLLNTGTGSFGSASSIAATNAIFYLTLADLDNDGDLDLAGAANNGSALFVRLNQQLAPTITSFSPNPAGAGVPVTLTGTNLTGATALSINGAAATILTNTATSITFRVPAGATATGTSSVTTPGGTASSTAFTVLPAPGNALALDGADDYVTGTSALLPQGNAARTLEAWVLTNTTGGVIFNYGTASANQRSGILVGGNHLYYVGENNDLQGNITITDGKWHHVAATYNGTTLSLYVDGVLDVSSAMGAFGTTGTNWNLGKRIPPLTSTELFTGRIDEMRVYNAALTLAQVQADMLSTTPALPGNLVAYYSFDEGTASGNNAGLTTLYDQSNNLYAGTLTNFSLASGNTTSNWVESYALVVPTVAAATAVAGTSFTANWTAPTIGTVTTYYVDVATNAAFTTGLTTTSVAAPATSLSITGRANATTYYYRVRAEKTAALGQGATFSYTTVTTLPLPTITSISPNPGVRGEAVTLTGTNLTGITAVSVNGVAATSASFINNTATSLTFQVPAAAGASGITSVTNAGGTGSITTFTTGAATPPGNALAFDGTDDYVAFGSPAALSNLGLAPLTMEAWVYCTNLSAVNSIIRKSGDYNLVLQPGGLLYAEVWSGGTSSPTRPNLQATTAIPLNRWTHVAATWDGTTLKVYVNGVDALGVQNSSPITTSEALQIGRSAAYNQPFNGRLDEVRIYSAALTPAQLQADMVSTASAVPASLKLYLNFDQAANTPGGNNVGQTTLYDQTSNTYAGTLTSFALTSGNTTSNYVESYALVVPTATAATGITPSGFTANWTAPAIGTVDNGYRVDVSTVNTFASVISGSPFTVSSTSQALTGLTAGTTYYYRVRADKTSVTGQGDYSNIIPVSTCALPVAIAQNAALSLDANGNATLAATAVNNGSTANCGAATNLSVSPSAFSCADAVPASAASSLSFNGTNQYVAIPTTSTVPVGNSSYTIEAWIKPNTMGVYGIIGWGNYSATNQVNALRLYNSGLVNYWWFNDITTPTADLSGAWHHVAATFNGTTRTLYLDGVAIGTDTPTGHAVPNANNLRIGSTNNGEYFNGSIDEVRVWSVARTAAQINAAKGVGLPGSTAGLVAYYRLNEGSGLTAADATGAVANLGTLTNGPTWTTSAAPVVNGSPVTLTVTDASGNQSTAPAVVTVQDNTAPVAYLLPSAPALATANVPEAAGYGVLYQLDVPDIASFNGLAAVPYAVNKSGVTLPANPSRVAYFMELTNGVNTKWVWASMDNFASNLTQLGLPNPTANNQVWSQLTTNLNVFSSAGAGVTTGSSLGTGRVEMWRWNYGQSNTDNVLGASGSTYDFGDQVNIGSGNYGSFQVHNVTAQQTVLAYNNWGGNGDGGGIGNIGIGNQVGGSGHPDWTFQYNANTYTTKRIYIMVPNATSATAPFTQNVSIPLNVAGTATLTAAQVYQGNGVDNCGSVTASVSPSTFNCANVGANTVTVSLKDSYGNTTSQTATVTVTVPATPITTWNGASSTTWTDCANWSYGQVPSATISAVIPTGQPRYPSLTTGTAPVLNLTINTGGSFTLASGATLQVNGDLTNGGTATLSGSVAFVGSAATQALGGSTSTPFTTVVVNKASGTVQLGQNLTINSALTLTSGTLTTGSYQANLGSSASISETETSYVIGKVAVNRTLTAGTPQAFSGLGLTLTPAAGSVSPGATLVQRTTGTALTGAGTSQSVKRYFDIQPAVNTGLNVTMDFAYFTHELNGIPTASLTLFKSVTTTAGPWANMRTTATSANMVTRAGLADFSIWTLGNATNPLPVELTTFTATPVANAAVRLNWATASEKNSARFEVERSTNGTAFDRIGTVAAQGTKASATDYALLDGKLPATATTLYYRLRLVDLDGSFSYSPVRVVMLVASATPQLLAYPNPAHATVRVMLLGPATESPLQVHDALGRMVYSQPAPAVGTETVLPLATLPTGVYVLRCGSLTQRLTLE